MPDPTWLLPARSIPVFVTAAVRFRYSGDVAWWDGVVVSEAVDVWGVIKADRNQRFYQRKGYDETIIDLSNPDTFAAARDRLAARMGLDPDLIADGVLFGPAQPGGKWLIGGLLGLRLTWTTTDVYANTRELALALAWQKVVES